MLAPVLCESKQNPLSYGQCIGNALVVCHMWYNHLCLPILPSCSIHNYWLCTLLNYWLCTLLKKRAGYDGLLVDFGWVYIGHMAYISYISCTLGLLPPIYIKYLVMYHIYVLNINYTWVEYHIHWLNIAYDRSGLVMSAKEQPVWQSGHTFHKNSKSARWSGTILWSTKKITKVSNKCNGRVLALQRMWP